MEILGIDVGGSGIKGAPVDITTGKLLEKRHRIPTPRPSTPKAVAKTIKKVCRYFDWEGPVGCGFPSVIQGGRVQTAANIDSSWIGCPGEEIIAQETGLPVRLINDADAAGLAEVRFGAGKGHQGVVILVTIGTGLGTALFVNGKLVPNTEFGHMELRGREAETWASDFTRQYQMLTWKKWGRRFNIYLNELEKLFWPDLFILGGGVSKKFDRFSSYLHTRAEIRPATMRNEAGIIGAALAIDIKGMENGKG